MLREQLKSELIKLHKQFVRQGNFFEAKKVLRLLRAHTITLGLSDVDWNVESELIRLGFKETVNRKGISARFTF